MNTFSIVVVFRNQIQRLTNVMNKKNVTQFEQSMNIYLFDEIDNEYIENFVDRIVIVENTKFFIFDIFDVRVSFNNVKQFVNEISIKMIS